MRSSTAILVLVLAALGCGRLRAARPPEACTHVQAVRQARGAALCEDAWTCARPPGGRFDRIGLHRLALCEGATGPIILYLPGMHMNGELPIAEPRNDLRVYLATTGVRTWGLDYRTHVVPAAATPAELQNMRRWTADVFVDDAAWAAAFMRGTDPGPFALVGFSQGVTFAYSLAARGDLPLLGVVALDGTAGGARAADATGSGPALDVGGSRLPFPERERLLADVMAGGAGPSPLPGFPTAGAALADLLYSAPSFGGHGGLSNAVGGVSDIQVVAALLHRYDRWWSRAALDARAPERPARPLPVLAFASANMGAAWAERVRAAATAYGQSDATVHELPGYGHLDVLVGRRAAQDVFEPTRAWLRQHAGS